MSPQRKDLVTIAGEARTRRLYYIAEASKDAAQRGTLAEPNTEGRVLLHLLQIPEKRNDAAYNLPFSFNPDKCWGKLGPTLEQIDGYISKVIEKDMDVDSQPKPIQAFWEVEWYIDLIPPEYTYNVIPRHSFADLHTEEDSGVLAWPLGSVKIWITYGPEKRNTGNLGNRSLERDKFFRALLETDA
ncbi:hypothetical protein BDD12DRAFT_907471 [Trichophaea hybrida]|nr:hypothetical protein BDD12DRAFT_907471 [Trichophaea hybrida]